MENEKTFYGSNRSNYPNAPPHIQNINQYGQYVPPQMKGNEQMGGINHGYNNNVNYNNNNNFVPLQPINNDGTYHPNPYNHNHNNSQGSFKFANNFSIPSLQVTGKLIQIDNRIANFSQYIWFVWVLFTLSLLGLFSSIFSLNDTPETNYNHNQQTFETINFFVNLLHIASYFFAIQAFSKQNYEMNIKVEYLLIALAGSNFLYFFFFIFMYHVYFVTWCFNLFFLCNNALLYYQAKELTAIFKEREQLRRLENINF